MNTNVLLELLDQRDELAASLQDKQKAVEVSYDTIEKEHGLELFETTSRGVTTYFWHNAHDKNQKSFEYISEREAITAFANDTIQWK